MYTADCSAPSAVTPTSRPAISDTRRSGVSARRLKKPVSMSSARFVPVFTSENMPPWMNATAIANDTYECVGKPGRRVAARSPLAFTGRAG